MQSKQHSKGVALITALLIVSIIVVLVVSLSVSQRISIRRTSNLLSHDQAIQYALGAEAWAKQILIEDLTGAKVDHLQEDWATLLPATKIAQGTISGQLMDLQARFNLNNLVKDGKPVDAQVKIFKRLLVQLKLDDSIAPLVIDWIDADQKVSENGAEDWDYQNSTVGYRTPDAPMAGIEELRQIKGMNNETYTVLSPFVVCLPETTAINVNTAENSVIQALATGITESVAEKMTSLRENDPFTTTASFISEIKTAAGNQAVGSSLSNETLSIVSSYFILTAKVSLLDITLNMRSLLERNNQGEINVIRRYFEAQ